MLMCVPLPAHRAVLGQDGDAALALDVVAVHHAFGDLLVLAEGAALAQQLVDQGGLAVVDVGDDGDVADRLVMAFGFFFSSGRPGGPASSAVRRG
jgi:hypothetical protein